MIILKVLIGNAITVKKRFSFTGVTSPDTLKACKTISLEGIFDEEHNYYYPPHVIERIEISELKI